MEGFSGVALDTLRKGAGGVIGVIFVLLLIASFIIWFPAGWFQGYGARDVITVGDIKIGPQDYMRAQQDVLRAMSTQAGRSLSIQEARALGLDSRVLERLVGGAAVDTHARALGLGISDTALLEDIMKDSNFKDAAGNFSPAAFQQALQSIGMTEQGYLASLRERNLRRQILSTVGQVVSSPSMLIDALNTFNGETRTLRYVLVPASVAGTIPDPTEEELKAYYDNHQSKVHPAGISARSAFWPSRQRRSKTRSQITEADVRAAYEKNKDQLGNPERRKIQQIPFPDLELPPRRPMRRFSPAPISWRSPRSEA